MTGGGRQAARRRAWRRGLFAEALCRLTLRLKGYRILAKRVRTPSGEIDIVALRGNVLAIVEVKARPTLQAALEAVTPRQRGRLERAALSFLGRHPAYADRGLRFDAMLVTPRAWPRHIADAWRAEEGR